MTNRSLQETARHPLGRRARVLLTSVFGPYAQDDEYGSRLINPMELYHNQVTRVQGPFSLRIFHRSWGLMLIQANITAPCILLDFPDLDRFVREIRERKYDVIGISSILVNILKVKAMCSLIRQYQPQATIVVGGHVANLPDLADRIDADYIVRGEGVAWFRRFLGEPEDGPIRHPLIPTPIDMRSLGIDLRARPEDTAATLIPSVGCPLGCNFCATSSMFGGKGRFVNFYSTGDEVFEVARQLESEMKARSFFVMDENFLLYRKRAMRLLELMEQEGKAWTFYVFSSANVLSRYDIRELVSLGISWVWLGLEGEDSSYQKLEGIDARQLVRNLQSHGIRVLGSSIIGMEDHSPANMDRVIDYAVAYATDFHQFMLYTPLPGTPLFSQMSAAGKMKGEAESPLYDWHGQYRFNFHHPHLQRGEEESLLLRAFQRDYERNGPSVIRTVRTMLAGWRRYRNDVCERIRRRFAWEARDLGTSMAAAVGAATRFYRDQTALRGQMQKLLQELYTEFGWKARLAASLGGRYVYWQLCRELRRLNAGWTREPPTFYERNFEPEGADVVARTAVRCRSVAGSNRLLADAPLVDSAPVRTRTSVPCSTSGGVPTRIL